MTNLIENLENNDIKLLSNKTNKNSDKNESDINNLYSNKESSEESDSNNQDNTNNNEDLNIKEININLNNNKFQLEQDDLKKEENYIINEDNIKDKKLIEEIKTNNEKENNENNGNEKTEENNFIINLDIKKEKPEVIKIEENLEKDDESNANIYNDEYNKNYINEQIQKNEIMEEENNKKINREINLENNTSNNASIELSNGNKSEKIKNIDINIENNDIKNESKMQKENQNEIRLSSIKKLNKSQQIVLESWSQTSEEIPSLFPKNNTQIIINTNSLNNNNKSNNPEKISIKLKNDTINSLQNLLSENDEIKKNIRISKISKGNKTTTSKKEEKNIFNNIELDLSDNKIIAEEELKKLNLNNITLRFIDALYKDVDKLKKKEDLKIYEERLSKIANMILYMKYSNQLKVLECLKKTANSYKQKELYNKLEKKVDELNKIKKHGFSDYSSISNSNDNISKYGDKGYSERMSDAKYYK